MLASIASMGKMLALPRPAQARELGVGVVYQELSLLRDVSVEENLLMGHLPARRGIVNKRELRARATQMLERVGLNRVDPGMLVSDLPVATRQMVEIAKVLGANARIVIFDEPTTSLSEKDAQHLLQLINRLKKEEGVAVLYVTHRLEEIFEIGDRITVLRDGQFITTAPTSEFTHDTLDPLDGGTTDRGALPATRPETIGQGRVIGAGAHAYRAVPIPSTWKSMPARSLDWGDWWEQAAQRRYAPFSEPIR